MTNKKGALFIKYLEEKLGLNGHENHENKECQFQQNGVYVRDDDQDWGNSGINDMQTNNKEISNA